jgi:hypothetical protein
MNRKRAAGSQHEPGVARTDETEDGIGCRARSPKGTAGPEPRLQRRIRRDGQDALPGTQPDAMATSSAARVQWLAAIRVLARAAAQADHDAAARTSGRPIPQKD